jgi:hypothetical protein
MWSLPHAVERHGGFSKTENVAWFCEAISVPVRLFALESWKPKSSGIHDARFSYLFWFKYCLCTMSRGLHADNFWRHAKAGFFVHAQKAAASSSQKRLRNYQFSELLSKRAFGQQRCQRFRLSAPCRSEECWGPPFKHGVQWLAFSESDEIE